MSSSWDLADGGAPAWEAAVVREREGAWAGCRLCLRHRPGRTRGTGAGEGRDSRAVTARGNCREQLWPVESGDKSPSWGTSEPGHWEDAPRAEIQTSEERALPGSFCKCTNILGAGPSTVGTLVGTLWAGRTREQEGANRSCASRSLPLLFRGAAPSRRHGDLASVEFHPQHLKGSSSSVSEEGGEVCTLKSASSDLHSQLRDPSS